MIINGNVTESGNLLLNLEDGTTINVGNVKGVPGPQGEKGAAGAKGDPGESGLITTVVQNTVIIEAVTTNPSITYTTQNCSYTVLGDRIRVKYKIGWSSATAGSGSYLVSLPSDLKFNTSKDPLYTGTLWSPDVASMTNYLIPIAGNYVYASNWSRIGFALPYDSTRFRIAVDNSNTGGLSLWASTWAAVSSAPMLFNFEFDIWK